jgi:hypothetical protein
MDLDLGPCESVFKLLVYTRLLKFVILRKFSSEAIKIDFDKNKVSDFGQVKQSKPRTMFLEQWTNHALGTFLLLAAFLPSFAVANFDQLPILASNRHADTLKGWKWVDGYKTFEYGVSDDYQGHKCLVIRYVGSPPSPPFPYPLPAYRATANLPSGPIPQ